MHHIIVVVGRLLRIKCKCLTFRFYIEYHMFVHIYTNRMRQQYETFSVFVVMRMNIAPSRHASQHNRANIALFYTLRWTRDSSHPHSAIVIAFWLW